MSLKVEKILGQAVNFEKIAKESLISEAKKKEKKKGKKEDSKEKSTKEDKKDSKKSTKKKSSYYDALLTKLAQGAPKDLEYAKNLTSSRLQSIQAVNSRNDLTPDQVKEYVGGYMQQAYNDFIGNMITNEQYSQIASAGQRKMFGTDSSKGLVPINWNLKPQTTPAPAAAPAKPVAPVRRAIPHRTDVENAQRALNNLKSYNKIEFDSMLDPDGKLGPLTQKALKAYKAYVNIPSLTDEQAIKALNTKREEAPTGPSVQQQYESGTLKTLNEPPMGGRDETVI